MKIAQILKKFKKMRVGVIGDLMLDRYILGEADRISPEAPTPVVRIVNEELRLGGAANTAANVAALGGKTIIFGMAGSDTVSDMFVELLQKAGIDTSGVIRTSKPTIEKTRVIALGQQIVRLDKEGNEVFDEESARELRKKISELVNDLDALVVSDYDKGVVTAHLARLIRRAAQKRGIPVVVAPKPAHFRFFRSISVVVPNRKEAEGIIGRKIEGEEDVRYAGEIIAKRARSPLLITRGAYGMSLFENGSVRHIPSAAREVYDVTGAGDTVAAVLSLGLGCGIKLYDAAVLANAAAGIVVGKRGTATVSPEELKSILR